MNQEFGQLLLDRLKSIDESLRKIAGRPLEQDGEPVKPMIYVKPDDE